MSNSTTLEERIQQLENSLYQAKEILSFEEACAMAKLHNEIRRYNDFSSESHLHDLNVFMMRLLFCFFAEDTAIFEKGIFTEFIRRYTLNDGSNLTETLDEVFNVMDEPLRIGSSKVIAQFPYVNGGLFHTRITIPKMGVRARRLILECGEMNWGEINPDIFGSMMQAVVTPDLRGEFGMHYTSVPNIMKVIQPLFLNDLEEAFVNASNNAKKLDELLIRISKIKLFDPACGSGNFLIITYKELRRLEIRIWKRITEITGLRIIPFSNISISQFYGIEIDSFAHEIAMLSLWLAEHQMNAEFTRTFTQVKIDALPLKNISTIIQDNACRVDWNEVCPHTSEEEVYVFGNPPYLGSAWQNKEQKKDMSFVFKGFKNYKNLDFISCWFLIGAKYIKSTKAKCAFVSTNSIVQGEQVIMLWKPIFDLDIDIYFAHSSFKWTNNAKYNAGVTCVIIGLSDTNYVNERIIYKHNKAEKVNNINGYLQSTENVFVGRIGKPISEGFIEMFKGSMARDNGHLLLNEKEREDLLCKYPSIFNIIKPFIGANEFLKYQKRYCLWITEEEYEKASNIKEIKSKLDKVTDFRNKSIAPSTKNYANRPYMFVQRTYKKEPFIFIPQVTSERREYVPIGWMNKGIVTSDKAFSVYNAPMWLFGVLSSKMQLAWLKTVGGRLETRLSYSSNLCYNNFPFPTISEAKRKEIEVLAEEVLLTRENHTEKTLAQMYDPDKMPKDLRDAHHALDLAVDSCYSSAPFTSDEERVEVLFKLYEKKNKK